MSLSVSVMGPKGGSSPRIIRVLLLDDSSFDRTRIRRLSRKTDLMMDLTEVASIAALKEAIACEVFDLVLIDYRLPQGDGLEVLAHIQGSKLNHDAATIMITGDGDMETAVAAMRNGCHDFLAKEAMTADQLGVAMVGAMRAAAAQRDLAAQTAHQREVIRQGLTAALMDREVQDTVVALFKEQLQKLADVRARYSAQQDHSDLDAFLTTLRDDDEFIFN